MAQPSSILFTRIVAFVGVYLMLLLLVLASRPSPHDNPSLRKLLSEIASKPIGGGDGTPVTDP
ncbi:hypothetical protein KP509_07G036700 [Ceratopteris richardii]|uniref:Uncharacterized protein n=1 Tax=Ceratopteris richardii TaxID=49495 RepID=A0A8T2UA30_CERRI|nr:hypothetical protein KP509_07G036700 [Ceratopteris richardii]